MMLKAHMDAVEKSLVHTSKIPANSGHSLHKGTPREAFIKEFLQSHLSSSMAIGTGEIIDANSVPNSPRNQFDIVIYKKNYPKLDFGGGISGFLIESVVATIEVKSILDENALEQSIKSANNAKMLVPHVNRVMTAGWIPPKVLNFVISYDGPAKMSTVHRWIGKIHSSLGIPLPSWGTTNRTSIAGTAIDGIFVLEKGFIILDNTPLSFNRPGTTRGLHTVCDSSTGSLLIFFLLLQQACDQLEGAWLDPKPYVRTVSFSNLRNL